MYCMDKCKSKNSSRLTRQKKTKYLVNLSCGDGDGMEIPCPYMFIIIAGVTIG